jgi:Tfp pilus assembly protein PilF
MPSRFLLSSILVCSIALPAFSQGHPGGGGGGTRGGPGGGIPGGVPTTGNNNVPGGIPTAIPNPTFNRQPTFFSGKVVLDDGTELTEPVSIQTICQGQRHTEAYTDSRGDFSFQFGNTNTSSSSIFQDASTAMAGPNPMVDQRNWRDCQIQAVLAGFTSETIELAGRANDLGNNDLGRLPLHRVAHVEGTSISVTSAAAPPAARKAWEKGRDQEKKQKWEDAQKSFEKAVELYPKYAVAWYELGRVQGIQHDVTKAKASFQKSLEADPKYVNPYHALAQLAFQEKNWTEVDAMSSKLIALNPVNFVDAYFMQGVANLYMNKLDAAQKACEQGIRADAGQHQVPKLEYLLARVLMQKHQYPEAADHLRQYITLTKDPGEQAEARKELDQLGSASAAVQPSAPATKQ